MLTKMKKINLGIILLGMKMSLSAVVLDETLLLASQGLGHTLYNTCVSVLPITEGQLAYCSSLKLSYTISLQILTQPYGLKVANYPDRYLPNPFSPCTYEVAYLIIPDICIGL